MPETSNLIKAVILSFAICANSAVASAATVPYVNPLATVSLLSSQAARDELCPDDENEKEDATPSSHDEEEDASKKCALPMMDGGNIRPVGTGPFGPTYGASLGAGGAIMLMVGLVPILLVILGNNDDDNLRPISPA